MARATRLHDPKPDQMLPTLRGYGTSVDFKELTMVRSEGDENTPVMGQTSLPLPLSPSPSISLRLSPSPSLSPGLSSCFEILMRCSIESILFAYFPLSLYPAVPHAKIMSVLLQVFDAVCPEVTKLLVDASGSEHAAVAQRALQMWRSEAFTALVRRQAASMVPALMPALIREGKVCLFVPFVYASSPPPPIPHTTPHHTTPHHTTPHHTTPHHTTPHHTTPHHTTPHHTTPHHTTPHPEYSPALPTGWVPGAKPRTTGPGHCQ